MLLRSEWNYCGVFTRSGSLACVQCKTLRALISIMNGRSQNSGALQGYFTLYSHMRKKSLTEKIPPRTIVTVPFVARWQAVSRGPRALRCILILAAASSWAWTRCGQLRGQFASRRLE
jgi:hypothetical protein